MRYAKENEIYEFEGTSLQITVTDPGKGHNIRYRVLANGPTHHFTVGDKGFMGSDDFYRLYRRVRDCSLCGTARIRYVNQLHLAVDRKCWSCYGNSG